MFGRATIRLGIGPHSSSLVFTDDGSCVDYSRLNIASLDVIVLNQI